MPQAAPDALPQMEADAQTAGKLCSICQTAIIAGEKLVCCPDCSLPFHAECWQENRGCSVYGCPSAPKTVKGQVATEAVSNAWQDEKPCPSCGRKIKAQALKCRFCGASFSSRDVISRQEFARRDYEGPEYISVRNKIVALFLFCAAGCFAPIGLILVLVLIKTKKFMGIDFDRLPAALRAVLWSAVGVSTLLTAIMLLLLAVD